MEKEKPAHKIRREREIETLKRDVIRVARKLARSKEGWEKWSIRTIAKEVAYTAPVLYVHFPGGKAEILGELEKMGFAMLRESLETAFAATLPHPASQMENLSLAAWDFAIKNPDLYQVMFNLQGVINTPASFKYLRNSADVVYQFFSKLPSYSGGNEELFFNWWAMVHGFISLSMSGHTPGMKAQLRAMLASSSRRFVEGLS